MYSNVSCRCSDGDVCHVDAQMIWWVNGTSKDSLYTSQVVENLLEISHPQLQPAADWLVWQAEAVCTKTVYLGSCAKDVSILMLHLPFYIFLQVQASWEIFLQNMSLGIMEEWSDSFGLQESLFCSEILLI